MPEYNTQVSFDIKKDGIYEIISAEQITTRSGLEGLRVELKAKEIADKRNYAVTLWTSDTVSASSKFGSFLAVLGNNTDDWLHKWIRVTNWQNRLCEIQLVPAPKLSLNQAAKRLADKE